MSTLTRIDISAVISRKLGVSQVEGAELLDSVLTTISDEIKKNEVVKISSFGNFILRKKKERIGRNPKTGQEAVISARNSLTFSASQMLKKKVNGNNG